MWIDEQRLESKTPRIWTYIYTNGFWQRHQHNLVGERNLLNNWLWINSISVWIKLNHDLYFSLYTKSNINSRWITDLDVKAKFWKFIKENRGEYYCNVNESSDFLECRNIELFLVKIKNCTHQNTKKIIDCIITFSVHVFVKGIVFILQKELLQVNKKRTVQ